ncbi:hypothetical protein HG531_007561 [Fusarium graminearum]|nr:hypothetical protein HG531_007561 [Fusarium graminearum]
MTSPKELIKASFLTENSPAATPAKPASSDGKAASARAGSHCFTGTQLVPDDTGLALLVEDAAFGNGFSVEVAGYNSEELCCSGVEIHTWEFSKSQTDASSSKSRESLAIGVTSWSAVEAEVKVFVLWEEVVAVDDTI